MFYGGAPFFSGAWKAARHQTTNMNTLIALGTAAAYFYSLGHHLPDTVAAASMGAEVYYDTAV